MSFDVNYIAGLAHLTLSEDEKQGIQEKMEGILKFVQTIQELDLSDYEPSSISYEMPTVLREDTVGSTLSLSEIELNAPKIDDNSIIVPQVIQK